MVMWRHMVPTGHRPEMFPPPPLSCAYTKRKLEVGAETKSFPVVWSRDQKSLFIYCFSILVFTVDTSSHSHFHSDSCISEGSRRERGVKERERERRRGTQREREREREREEVQREFSLLRERAELWGSRKWDQPPPRSLSWVCVPWVCVSPQGRWTLQRLRSGLSVSFHL